MSDTFTSNLNMVKPQIGGSVDSWGSKWNTNLDTLDTIFNSTGTAVNMRFASANFDDNAKAIFGTGDDLEIYHDGSHSNIVDVGQGNLRIIGNSQIYFGRSIGGEAYATFNSDSSVNLYYDNSVKFVTSSSGVSVTGDIAVTGNVDGVDVSGLSTTVSNLSSSLSTVATSGSYNDLSNRPTIPTNNNQLSNGAGYTTFTSNQATNSGSNVTFGTITINGSNDLTLNTGNWTGEKSGKIQRHSSHMYFQTDNAGRFIFRNSGGGEGLYITASSGALVSSNNITAYSDIRLKKDVKTIENALDKVCALRGVEYTRISNDEREIGVIAQEVKEVVPELVDIKDNSDSFGEGISDIHTMKYQNTVGLLIEAIKELKDEIKELKGV